MSGFDAEAHVVVAGGSLGIRYEVTSAFLAAPREHAPSSYAASVVKGGVGY